VGVRVFRHIFTGRVPRTVGFVQDYRNGLAYVALDVGLNVHDQRSAHGYLLAVRKLCKM
jgi:hypothetical protein